MQHFMGYRDPKAASYPLMDSPKPTIILSLMYLIFVLFLGPAWMKERKPFILGFPMFVYNMSLVLLSLWVFSNIFFVLRKKDRHINFLHVFHHSTVPITAWYAISYGSGGYNMFFMTVNSFVHIWMYLHYGLAALGPGIQKYLWWKKYLTSLQLIQFILVTGYFLQLNLFPKEGCLVTQLLTSISLGQALVYLILFTNFYFKSYVKVPQKRNNIHHNNLDRMKEQNGNTYLDRMKEQNGNTYLDRMKEPNGNTYLDTMKEQNGNTYLDRMKEQNGNTYLERKKVK